MAIVDLVMPKLGESITEATILKWNKKMGDSVKMDEPVLEIATDKVDSEVPSTAEGIIEEILFKPNDIVPVGTVIARIRSQTEAANHTPKVAVPTITEITPAEEIPYTPKTIQAPNNAISTARFYSPLVLNIAANEGVHMTELEHISGTGNEGRVTKKDILQYIEQKKSTHTNPTNVTVLPNTTTHTILHKPTTIQTITTIHGNNIEVIEMDRMRKLIAKHMIDSKHTSAHVTSFAETDVTNMVLWREKMKKEFEKREGEKITFTPLFIEAIIHCIKKYPWLNSSVEGDKLIVKKDIHVGMATALPTGNLIVPVIKNANQLNLAGLTKQVNHLAHAARTNKLKPDDTQGGTFTLTNVGSFGSIMGTPIINQPQVAILAVGAIKKRPVVIETAQGDSIAIRHIMYLSLSYDHRIIDGALGSTFLNAVAKELEHFNINRLI